MWKKQSSCRPYCIQITGGTTEVIYVIHIMHLNNISENTLMMFLKLNNFTFSIPYAFDASYTL
jgi:hypothetical protein